jgi:hypothetical protein
MDFTSNIFYKCTATFRKRCIKRQLNKQENKIRRDFITGHEKKYKIIQIFVASNSSKAKSWFFYSLCSNTARLRKWNDNREM